MGFSAHVGEAIPFDDKKAIEDVACYVVRNPLSLKKLVYLDGEKAVLYRSKMNPSLGRNFEAMDPLEWLARMADHIPDAGKHRTHFYGFYASRVRASRRQTEASDVPAELTTKRRCPPSWARLIMPAAGLCRVARGAACYSLDLVAVRARGRLIRSA